MKDFLIRKNNVNVSAYITDLNPSQITTNGALTIIDNSDPSNNIVGLPPNSYSLFLDNLFLASGYGFSSYTEYNKASYIVSTYSGVYSYIINELNKLNNNSIVLKYSYSDNKIDKDYTTYGWLKRYKTLDINRLSNTSYEFKLTNHDNIGYINNIQLYSYVNNQKIENYVNVGDTVQIYLNLYKLPKNTSKDSDIAYYAPDVIFNGETINFKDSNDPYSINSSITNNDSYCCITRSIDNINNNNIIYNKDFELVCSINNDVVYKYIFKDAIKWRYKILPFNTKILNLLHINFSNLLKTLDAYKFSDINFNSSNINSELKSLMDSIMNSNTNLLDISDMMIFLDDNCNIEFEGNMYQNDDVYSPSYDYFIIETGTYNIYNFDFYLNNIKNNNWNYIIFNYDGNNKNYRLYQSPQKYIGKHIWKIKYNYE